MVPLTKSNFVFQLNEDAANEEASSRLLGRFTRFALFALYLAVADYFAFILNELLNWWKSMVFSVVRVSVCLSVFVL